MTGTLSKKIHLPDEIFLLICDFRKYDEEILTKWELLVGLRRKYEVCIQHFRHLFFAAQHHPDFVIAMDLVPINDFYDD